jgi:hypothetical protein
MALSSTPLHLCNLCHLWMVLSGIRIRTHSSARRWRYTVSFVEIKALHALSGQEEAQLINYLKAARVQTGLLLNFGAARLVWRRFVY